MCRILNSGGEAINNKIFHKRMIENGNCIQIGSLSFDLSGIIKSQKLTLEVSLENTIVRNSWDFWVYPSKQEVQFRTMFWLPTIWIRMRQEAV